MVFTDSRFLPAVPPKAADAEGREAVFSVAREMAALTDCFDTNFLLRGDHGQPAKGTEDAHFPAGR